MEHFLNRFSTRIVGSVLATVLVAWFAGCTRESADLRGKGTAIPVQTARAVKRTFPITLTAIGTVQPIRSVAVKSQVDGVIQEIRFREGDEVKAGAVLVVLDRRPYENSLALARADLASAIATAKQATDDVERYQRLDQAAVVSKEQYSQYFSRAEAARANVQAREASVANAELQLSYTEIRAPIDGRTGQLQLHEGALVKANDAAVSLFTINQIAPIAVAYSIPESAFEQVRAAHVSGAVGVHASQRGNPKFSADGVLDFIDNAIDATTGTVTLKATFENQDRTLWPGQFVDVLTRLGDEMDAVLLPASAVQSGQRGDQVFVVKADKTVELRTVTVGRSGQGLVVIRDGVKVDEVVVTDGQLRLVPGALVEAKELAPTPVQAPVAGSGNAAAAGS